MARDATYREAEQRIERARRDGATELKLSGMDLTEVPEAIGQLGQLQVLDLSGNSISSLPEAIGQLTSLQRLNLSGNQISGLPEALSQLTSLQGLNLDNNPLNPELAAAYSQGTEVLLQYLRSQVRSQQVELNEAKLILVGEGEVGKTSLLGALRGDEWVENRPTTHGIEIKPVTVKDPDSDTEILLNAWDFGGQPVYRPTHQLFFSAPAVYLVVWKPREGPQQAFIEYWITLIKRRAPEAKIIIVSTHGGPNQRQPDIDHYDIVHRFGRDTVLDFLRVDSKPDEGGKCPGVEELKEAIARVAVSLPEVGRSVPGIWQQVRSKLQSTEKAYLSYSQVIELCAQQEMDPKEANLFLSISHILGHLIHYHHDALLKNIVILKPDWLAKAISFVLDDRLTRERQGLVELTRLNQLWHDPQRQERYPLELHPIFVKLMERFDLSYRVVLDPLSGEPSNTSLIAQLVSDQGPDTLPDWGEVPEAGDEEKQLICRIVDERGNSANAEGLFYQLIVRLHKYSLGREDYSKSVHWQRGLMLENDYNGRALLEQVGTNVRITVRAAFPEFFIHELTNEVKWLVEYFWRGLRCRVMVPCVDPCGKEQPGTGLFEIEQLIESKKSGRYEYPCNVSGCGKWQNIDSLLSKAPFPATSQVTIDELKEALQAVRREIASQDQPQLSKEQPAIPSQINLPFTQRLVDEAKDGPRLKLSYIKLKGFKSIHPEGQTINFKDITVLLGANGSGKSNLVSFFSMLESMMKEEIQIDLGKNGGAETLLYYGSKTTNRVRAEIEFTNSEAKHIYKFDLSHAAGDTVIFTEETISHQQQGGESPDTLKLDPGRKESRLPERAKYRNNRTERVVFELLRRCQVFQFHDTSKQAKIRNNGYIDDNRFLRSDAGNLAAFLYAMQNRDATNKYYRRIIRYIQHIMPQFGDFQLKPSRLSEKYIMLNWQEKGDDYLFGPHQISDGALRFMAIATLLLQPPETLPAVIVLDEPELGLHPSAIAVLTGMARTASRNCQIIMATQSPRLVDELEPENILIVERNSDNSCSEFKSLDSEKLTEWLERYSLSELWEKNVIGGKP